jgi:uncharacterized damage-inducible protein DinB
VEAKRIGHQLRASLKGPAWHGPSLLDILSDVSAEEAQARPVPAAHSIAELVAHVTAWINAARRGLESEVVSLEGAADWPPPGEWTQDLSHLRDAVGALASRVDAMSDEDLRQTVRSADSEYSRYVLLHGVTQHNLYHAGQMALLRKAVKTAR